MREVLHFDASCVLPTTAALLAAQGGKAGTEPSARTLAVCEEALALFAEHAAPAGLFGDIEKSAFADVYNGEGENAERSPLEKIHPLAERLALFTVTVGAGLSAVIDRLFAERDFALAAMLDAAASEGAELAAEAVENRYAEILAEGGLDADKTRLLRYSPGYCGWHVSGQRKLFGVLKPGEIGVTLRESCLMEPLKSVSGVLVAGPGTIHEFDIDYPFCEECADRACRARIRSVTRA